MNRRRLLLGAGALALLALAGLLVLSLVAAPRPGPTPENFRRLQPGMSVQDAERTLGGPGEVTGSFHPVCEMWQGRGLTIYLYFDHERGLQDGIMTVGAGTSESLKDRPGFLNHLRRLLPW